MIKKKYQPPKTAQEIINLIQPHLGNPVIKKALGDTMREMGIDQLPHVQLYQHNELYERFQAVLDQHAEK